MGEDKCPWAGGHESDKLNQKVEELSRLCTRLEIQLAVLNERLENAVSNKPAILAGGLSGSSLAALLYAMEKLVGK